MRVVDPIVLGERLEAGLAELDLTVPSDLAFFDGHFPGAPVVPGVVQIGWAVTLARPRLAIDGAFAGVEALKFHEALGPGARVRLELHYAAETRKLHFSFASATRRLSSGRVRFGARP